MDDDGGTTLLESTQIDQFYDGIENDSYSLAFISRSRTIEKIRRSYLSKLTYQKVWLTPSEKPKSHETAIIFDWDDTLLCTSFINPNGVSEDVELSLSHMSMIK